MLWCSIRMAGSQWEPLVAEAQLSSFPEIADLHEDPDLALGLRWMQHGNFREALQRLGPPIPGERGVAVLENVWIVAAQELQRIEELDAEFRCLEPARFTLIPHAAQEDALAKWRDELSLPGAPVDEVLRSKAAAILEWRQQVVEWATLELRELGRSVPFAEMTDPEMLSMQSRRLFSSEEDEAEVPAEGDEAGG
jgi:hypothetical protein